MAKGGMLVPSTPGRMAHMQHGKTYACVPSAEKVGLRNWGGIRMTKDGMLVPNMPGRMAHMLH